MKNSWIFLAIGVLVAVAGCGDNTPMGPSTPQFHKDRAGSPALNVVSYNVYVGAHVEDLLTADPNEIPLVAAQLWGNVLATNFSERAMAIAKQIDDANAHLVALQEVALYRFDPETGFDLEEPLPIPLPAPDADVVLLDFLDMLLAALDARGLSYVDAAVSENLDLELPMACLDPELCTSPVADIRLTDRDVILVRDDVNLVGAADGNFQAVLPVTIDVMIPGVPMPVTVEIAQKPSGWASVEIMFKGLPYLFVNTHLEAADVLPGGGVHPGIAQIQEAQLAELLGMVGAATTPVIMVGDFNSDDDGSTTATYQTVREAGFVDAWLIGRPRGAGLTANQSPDLMNEANGLFHRIDYVFYRDAVTAVGGPFRGSVAAYVLGEEQRDRTPSGLWPSDHAGVATTLRIAPAMK